MILAIITYYYYHVVLREASFFSLFRSRLFLLYLLNSPVGPLVAPPVAGGEVRGKGGGRGPAVGRAQTEERRAGSVGRAGVVGRGGEGGHAATT